MSTALRHAEYYSMQDIFDDLYERSKNNATKGLRRYEHIISKDNILLAFRNIKANTGSKTAGTDGITIEKYRIDNVDEFSNLVIVHEDVHRLIHATSEMTIERYRDILQLDGKQLKKLNQFRKICNLIALV